MLYDHKFAQFSGLFMMHWLVPYVIRDISDGGTVQLVKMNGELIVGQINGSRLKLYMEDPISRTVR